MLGAAQLWAILPWLGATAVLHWQSLQSDVDDPVSADRAAARFAIVALALAIARSVDLVGVWLQAHGDRRSAREMLVWLP